MDDWHTSAREKQCFSWGVFIYSFKYYSEQKIGEGESRTRIKRECERQIKRGKEAQVREHWEEREGRKGEKREIEGGRERECVCANEGFRRTNSEGQQQPSNSVCCRIAK